MKDLYDYLVREGVTPNGLFILHATHNGYMYPNYVNFKHEQYRLSLSGYLVEVKSESTTYNTIYKITDKGLHLLRESTNIVAKMKPAKKSEVPFSEWETKIQEYNEIFPKGKKDGASISFRTNPKDLFDRFKWFFKEYPEYTWDDVLTATKKYVEAFEVSQDYKYLQTSKYFIKKEDKSKSINSTLATMCYNMKEGNDEEINTGFHYFGP